MKVFFDYESVAAKGYMIDMDKLGCSNSDSVWSTIVLILIALSPLLIFIPWDKLF